MKSLSLFIVLLLSCTAVFSQSVCGLEMLPITEIIAKSELIVEGKVVATQSFRRRDDIFTKNTISIYKRFKGKLLQTEIEVITWGGEIDGDFQTYSNLLRLKNAQTGVFFLIPSQIIEGSYDTYGNSQGFFGYYVQDKVLQARNTFYNAKNIENDLFQVIEKEAKMSRFRVQKSDYERAYEDKIANLKAIYGCDGVGIEYGFRNVNFQSGATSILTFDVWSRTIWGVFEFSKGNVMIAFNPFVFGNNVVSNGKLLVTKGNVIFASDYLLNYGDISSNEVSITADASLSINPLFSLDTVGGNIFHIEMEVANIFQNPTISFDESGMMGESDYRDAADNQDYPFECLVAADSLSDIEGIALTSILDFYPDTIPAGIGQVLTIVGTDFGADRIGTYSGYVAFTDDTRADNTGIPFNSLHFPLDTDYLLWSDTLIMVRVPSTVDNDSFRVAGTGQITVKKKGILSTPNVSIDVLTVPYAVWDRVYPNNLSTDTSFTARLYGRNTLGGYDIFFQTTFKDLLATTGEEDAFKRALVKWRCSTYVNWKMVDVTLPFPNPQPCFVTAMNLGAGTVTTLAQTGHTITNCSGSGSPRPISKGFAITFNNTITWHTDTSTIVPPGSRDLESVALHELGHGILLHHNNQTTDLMYFSSPTPTRRDIKYHDKQGGDYIVGISVLPVDSSYAACLSPMVALNDSICGNVYLKDEKGMTFDEVKLFPNPTSNVAKLVIENRNNEQINILIYNGLGAEIKCISSTKYVGEHTEYLIDLNTYSSGLYRINIVSKNKIHNTTLIKY